MTQELHVWRLRLDTSAVRCRGAIAATQDMLASEVSRVRSDVAAGCDAASSALTKGKGVLGADVCNH